MSSVSPARVSSTTERSELTPKSGTVATKHPVQVARRNARERNRVRQVNQGFVTLRNHVPAGTKNKKLMETLRQAANYIQYLREILQSNGECLGVSSQPYYPSVQQNSCYPTTSMGFPAGYSSIGMPPSGHGISAADFTLENVNPAPFYAGNGSHIGYGQFSVPQEYAMGQSPGSYCPPTPSGPVSDYENAHQMSFQQKISPETGGSDPSPSNSSFMSDNSYEIDQELKYSNTPGFVQYS